MPAVLNPVLTEVLPVSAGAVVKTSRLFAPPKVALLPMKLSVPPALRVRLALVTFAVAPLVGAAAKPVWRVEAPAFNVNAPNVSLEAVLAVLLARKLNVPPARATAAASLRRLRLLVPVLSSFNVPPAVRVWAVTPVAVVATLTLGVVPVRPAPLAIIV